MEEAKLPESGLMTLMEGPADSSLQPLEGTTLKKKKAVPRIKKLKKRMRYYIIMMYVIGFYSGFLMTFIYVNTHYLQRVLEVNSGDAAKFNSYMGISWTIKPIYGYISECFFPFKYRLKSYIIFGCAMITTMSISLFIYVPGYTWYSVQFFFIYMGYGVIDTLGEGLTALILKTDKEIQMLSSMFDPSKVEEVDNKKNFGNFYNFRSLIRNIDIFIGGALASYLDIKWFFLAQIILSIYVAIYTIFGFYEPKVGNC